MKISRPLWFLTLLGYAGCAGRRALKKHVLEDVANALPSIRFVEEAGVDMNDHRNSGRSRIGLNQDPKPVRKLPAMDVRRPGGKSR